MTSLNYLYIIINVSVSKVFYNNHLSTLAPERI